VNAIYFWTMEDGPDMAGRIAKRVAFAPFYAVTWKTTLDRLKEGARFKVVVEAHEASPALLATIPPEFEVRKLPRRPPLGCMGAARWLDSLAVTKEGADDDLVALLDCRDMLVQRDPFDGMDGLTGPVRLFGEPPPLEGDEWNRDDQRRLQSNLPGGLPQVADLTGWRIVCAGGIAGPRRMVRDIAQQVADAACNCHGTDQAVMTYLYNHFWRAMACISWSDTVAGDWVLSGHHFRMSPCVYRDEAIWNGTTGRKYALVHQWDRTAWVEETLRDHYAAKSS
jgi:hypothetical protein